MERNHVLEVPNKSISHSYFIEYGLASIVAANGHKRLEVGLIGCEGMTGLPIVLGNDRSPNETFMQVPGNGIRIPADKLRKAIAQSSSLERACLSFSHAFMNQTASTPVNAREARPSSVRPAKWPRSETKEEPGAFLNRDHYMQQYVPPKSAFDPLELAVMKRAFDAAWTEITTTNLIDLIKDEALRKAVCLKLFSLVRTRPIDPEELRDSLLLAVSADAEE